MAMKEDRFERIRKVRSLKDLTEILSGVKKEITLNGVTASRLKATVATAADETYTLGQPGRVRKIGTKTRTKRIDFSAKISGFKAPSKASMEKHSKLLQGLYDNAKELDAIEAMLRSQFPGIKAQKAAIDAIEALREEVDSSLHTALEALNTVASKHIPKEMESLRDRAVAWLIDNLPENQYEDIGYMEYATVGDQPGEVSFSVYIEISMLKNGHGYVFDEYFITLTGVVNAKGGIAYFVNALPDFKVPGKFPLGKQVDSESAMTQRISMLLAHNDVAPHLDKAPLPLHDAEDAASKGFTAIRGVKGAQVKDDALYLEIASTTNAAQQKKIVSETSQLLNLAMRRKKDAAISHKKVTKGAKTFLKFILVFKPGTTPTSVNAARLSEISHILDLTPDQMRKLRTSMLD